MLGADETTLSDIERQIREVKDIEVIDSIWRRLDKITGLAEARLRILLSAVPEPKLLDTPNWLSSQFANLKSDLIIQEQALLACRAMLAIKPDIRCTVEDGPLGRVGVEWDVDEGRLCWMVGNSDLPWPGTMINVLHRTTHSGDVKLLAYRSIFGVIKCSQDSFAIGVSICSQCNKDEIQTKFSKLSSTFCAKCINNLSDQPSA